MSKIEDLIQKLCPNGVEYRKLGDVCEIVMGVSPQGNTISETDGFEFHQGKTFFDKIYLKPSGLYTLNPLKIVDADYILMSVRAPVGTVNLTNRQICIGRGLCGIKAKKNLYKKYVFFFLEGISYELNTKANGATFTSISSKEIKEIAIPVPPIEVQQEIVRILDKFSTLSEKLNRELELRKKQYEYYREKMLSFEGNGVLTKEYTVDELCNFRNGKGHEKSIVENGEYVVVNSKFISSDGQARKYSEIQISPLYKDDLLMVMSDLPNGKALAKCFLVDKNDTYTLNQRICALAVKDKNLILIKFLYYILNRNEQLLKYDNGVDQTNLKKGDILDVKISIPSFAEQERIVSILDKFDTLVNDQEKGLPAEIRKVQQQYEYYRDKLLTF